MGEVRPGDRLGDYEILEQVASGGMGRIFRAWDARLDRAVAIKVITGPYSADEQFQQRFRHEALHLASVDHPNVIPVYGVGETDAGDPYLAMKFVEGTDLQTRVRSDGRLGPELAVRIVEQVAWALDAAHERRLVHRDVKPANVLLSGSGERTHAYLTDFGLIKALESRTELTMSGQWVGTAGFAAPEQIRGADVGPPADVYSLGCVLYFCLAGEEPFSGSPAQVMWAHMNDPLPPLDRGIRSAERLDEVVRRATEKDPVHRWSTASDLAQAARGALEGETAAAPTVPAPTPEAEPTRPLPAQRSGSAPPPTAVMSRRRRWPVALAAVGVVAIAAAALAFALGAFDGSAGTDGAIEPAVSGQASQSGEGDTSAQQAGADSDAFVRTSLDSESGASAVLPRGRRSLESFGPRRQRTRVDADDGTVAIVDYTPEDPPNPGDAFSTTGRTLTNRGLGIKAAEYVAGDCGETGFCVNYPLDLGGFGFGVLAAAATRGEARSIARTAARTLRAPEETLQPPDTVEDCASEHAPNVSELSVRNMSCAEADDLTISVISDLAPGRFESAGFDCEILGDYGPRDGPILGASDIRCAQGDRAFRFDWGD